MKRTILAVLLVIAVLTMAGCGGGGGGSSSPSSYTTEKTEIEQTLSGFKTAVETYDVNGMLAVFGDPDPSAMVLTIQEGNISYKKSYSTLKKELEEDETNQLTWRKEPVQGGRGYKLDMVLGSYAYSNMSSSGGYASQTFEIWESSENPVIGRTETDSGTIIWSMVKTTGKWKAVSMTITFNSMTTSAQNSVKAALGATVKGFRFGKAYINF